MGVIISPTAPVRLHIYDTSGGEPNTLLYSSINTNVPSGSATYTFNFSGANLGTGVYAFVTSYESGTHDASNHFTVIFDSTNSYAGGSLYQKIGTGSWSNNATYDVIATIYYS
jgi:hypothetical protein